MLISGILDRDAIKDYPKLCDSVLNIEQQMYVCHYKRPCLAEHLKILREMKPNVRCMFPAVEKLLRLLLIAYHLQVLAKQSDPSVLFEV